MKTILVNHLAQLIWKNDTEERFVIQLWSYHLYECMSLEMNYMYLINGVKN